MLPNERASLTWFYSGATVSPEVFDDATVVEYLRTFAGREGVLGALGVYRAAFTSIDQTEPLMIAKMVEEGFVILDPQLARQPYAIGDSFGIADAALFCAERWASDAGITLSINVQRHYERMLARPAVHMVRQLWGEE